MYKRLELHNHTTESDASITCRELVEYMVSDHADAFAITDHNTISGHRKIRKLLAEEHFPIQCIYGMEYTTYYGPEPAQVARPAAPASQPAWRPMISTMTTVPVS